MFLIWAYAGVGDGTSMNGLCLKYATFLQTIENLKHFFMRKTQHNSCYHWWFIVIVSDPKLFRLYLLCPLIIYTLFMWLSKILLIWLFQCHLLNYMHMLMIYCLKTCSGLMWVQMKFCSLHVGAVVVGRDHVVVVIGFTSS